MENIEGKKILILGANAETISLVQKANEMGVKTIVTSTVGNDVAKKYAWKSFDIDGMDVPGIIALVKQEKIDGVLVGVANILITSYYKVCKALDLPCYASEEIVNVFSYKDIFKATCERYGVHGILEYYLDDKLNPEDISSIEFPVVVKPVDGNSGLGISLVYKKEELKDAVNKALSFSKCKRFIVEKYMQCDDMGMYYTFKDGQCSPSCIYDRFTTNEQMGLSKVCLGGIYPSKHLKEYYERMHENVVRMFKEIGIKNGVLMLTGFYDNGEFYLYDTGFRLQGEAPHLFINAINGFDQREMLIRYALTGSEGDFDLIKQDDPFLQNKYAATVWFLLKEGTINKIEGLDDILSDKRVIANIQRLHENDTVQKEWIGTERQVLTRIYIVCDNKDELKKTIKEYQNKIKVYDVNGNNMLLNGFNVDEVF